MPISRAEFEQGEERYSIENEIIRFLDERDEAYNVREITNAVVDTGWSEANVEEPGLDDIVGYVLDLATVNSILDELVNKGALDRRIVDAGDGERSYYLGP